jgi:non-specific serine/threonine protein kinase
MPEEISFGTWLRSRRRLLDLTQQNLAEQVGCARITLRRIEADALKPSKELAQILLEKLGISEFDRPQWILFARGLAGFPTPPVDSSVSQPLSNLPASLTTFIGREKEQAEVIKQIRKYRLVTLTGPGGVGKTRLSIKVGEQVSADYANGVWLVELASLNDPALLPQTVITLFGIAAQPKISPTEILINFLRAKTLLLILDNCEHLLDACAQLTDRLLKNCPDLKILATSRESLGITGEAGYDVPSLGLPDLHQVVDKFREYESVRLFEERAGLAQLDFTLTLENASSVAQICHRLDGIPLAIELAAVHVNLFSTEQIAARLNESFQLLTGGSRTALPRQQTIHASIDWSWNLLSGSERIVLQRLSIFAGGWTLQAANAVCNFTGVEEASKLMTQLLAKSLVIANRQPGRELRFHLHETIRQYALEKLIASGEANAVQHQHAEYYLTLADATRSSDLEQFVRLERIATEHDNLRAALAWSKSVTSGAELGLQLAQGLVWFWNAEGYWSEGCNWLESALAHMNAEGTDDPLARARGLYSLGYLLGFQGDYIAAKSRYVQSLQILRELGDRPRIALTIERLGWLAREQGDTATARARLEEALALSRDLENNIFTCEVTNSLAETMIMQGDITLAKDLLEENLSLARKVEYREGSGWALNHLGHIAQLLGDYERAMRLHEESLPLFQTFGSKWIGVVESLHCMGETALAQGDAALAGTHLTESLVLSQDLGERACIAWCLAGLAGVSAVNEDPERAAWLWGAAEAVRQSIGAREAPATHATHERLKAEVRKQLGEELFNTKWGEGKSASMEQAIVEAIR